MLDGKVEPKGLEYAQGGVQPELFPLTAFGFVPANREVLDIYERAFKANPGRTDLRWRDEHSQHIDPSDIKRFKQLGVITSMQGNHTISDGPWVAKRPGAERTRLTSYPWRALWDAGVVITNGTDTPVEKVDPIPSFSGRTHRGDPATCGAGGAGASRAGPDTAEGGNEVAFRRHDTRVNANTPSASACVFRSGTQALLFLARLMGCTAIRRPMTLRTAMSVLSAGFPSRESVRYNCVGLRSAATATDRTPPNASVS